MNKMALIGILMMLQTDNAVEGSSGLLHTKTGNTRLNLIELYSSEGCSSCPPADHWLSTLREEKTLWKSFVPVEFHVDYWDQLGWKDPYAKIEFTQRQRDYGELWKNDNIYTPAVVLNGLEWIDWRRNQADSTLEEAGPNKGSLEITEVSKKKFMVKFIPSSKMPENYFVHATLLGNSYSTSVSRGENSGENLHHDFVALSLKTTNLKKEGPNYVATVDLSKEKVTVQAKSYSVAFWVTDHAKLPIQAAGGDLSE